MENRSNILINTLIMTAVNLIMRSVSVSFNVYLTNRIGQAGIGLFQLIMSVYSLGVTFSCAGMRLAVTRTAVGLMCDKSADVYTAVKKCIRFACLIGILIASVLLIFSDFIASTVLSDASCAVPLKILSLSLPFISMSSALGGYLTAQGAIAPYGVIQFIEQLSKIGAVIFFLSLFSSADSQKSCIAVVAGMTVSEVVSFLLATGLFKLLCKPQKNREKSFRLSSLLRIALPDAAGTCARNILLTIEHILIPRQLKLSGVSSDEALSAYGALHALVMSVLLYPSAILTSFSSLLLPEMAKKHELGQHKSIAEACEKVIRMTLIFSIGTAGIFMIFAHGVAELANLNAECVQFITVLAPLVPVMYLDMAVDAMLKGLDQQIYSMRYNIIDSALCVIMVIFLLPPFAVKGYIFVLYISEIINFTLSIMRLIKVAEVKVHISDCLLKPIICLVIPSAVSQIKTNTAVTLITAVVGYIFAAWLCGCMKGINLKNFLPPRHKGISLSSS